MDKLKRIIAGSGLDVIKTKYLETKVINGKNVIIVESEGVKYELHGNKKVKIEPISDLMYDYKDEISEEDFKNQIQGEWKPVAGIHDGVITYTEEELLRIKELPKPRGWHFRPIYVDVENNVYFKGELQPELKDKYDQDGKLIE